MRRRAFLAAAGLTAFSGCTSRLEQTVVPWVVLDGVVVSNYTDTTVDCEFRVDRNGETIHTETVTSRSYDDHPRLKPLQCEWPQSPSNYTVAGRIFGEDEWYEVSVGEFGDYNAVIVEYRIMAPKFLGGQAQPVDAFPEQDDLNCGYTE